MNASAASTGSDSIRIVDDFSKTELQFALSSFQIHDEVVQTGLSGLCTRNHTGARLQWGVYADERMDQPLVSGTVECRSGQFMIEVGGLEQMVCGLDHIVAVQGDWGGIARAKISRRCQPLASEAISPPTDSPWGTVCSLEFHPVGELDPPCAQVCYRDDKVISIQSVDEAQCSGLASKLTGP